MTETGGTDSLDQDAVASLEPDEVDFDQDLAFSQAGEDEIMEQSYVPNDRPVFAGHHGETAAEQAEGASLDERLAAEVPDVGIERPGDTLLPEEQPLQDALGEDMAAEDLVVTDDPDGSEVGDFRAGRLVEPDQGAAEDAEKDMIATDVGIDGGAASAEEAAMHVVEDPSY
ncbi:DUF5709 domain-containing protein [Aquipuribacter hungaricus]|uniref:DUF5709 domain-containing protein n=1 Tax=Aquipuribacter hungaricus TaxID=545624 RepID=A0ABV7WN26_9MICO